MTVKQYRDVPDLLDQIKSLTKRLSALETSRRLGSSSIDGGELTVSNGDITIRGSDGERRLWFTHGDAPNIYGYADDASDDMRSRIVTYDSGGVTQWEANVTNRTSGLIDGGRVVLSKDYAYMIHQPVSGPATQIGLSPGSYSNGFYFSGKWISDDQYTDTNAVYMGTVFVGAGFGAYAHTFDYPYSTTPLILYTITGATANFNHCLVNPTVNGFTIGWSDLLAHNINYLVLRR